LAALEALEEWAAAGGLGTEVPPWAVLLASQQGSAETPWSEVNLSLALPALVEHPAAATTLPWQCIGWALPADEAIPEGFDQVLAAGPQSPWVVASAAAEGLSPARRILGFFEGGAPAEVVGLYERPDLRVDFVAPRNEQEEKIAAVWRELLGVARVGIHNSFLELGGDSLLASRLVTRLRAVFAVDLPIRLLFEASTVAELAEHIDGLRESQAQEQLQSLLAQVASLSEEDLEKEILRREAALETED